MEDFYYLHASFETVDNAQSFSCNRSSPSPRPRRRASRDDAGELRHHYLDACFRCGRILAENKDIFMYRGDTPFCSEECRQKQIDTDEETEKKRSRQSAAARREQQQRQRQSPRMIPVWAR